MATALRLKGKDELTVKIINKEETAAAVNRGSTIGKVRIMKKSGGPVDYVKKKQSFQQASLQ